MVISMSGHGLYRRLRPRVSAMSDEEQRPDEERRADEKKRSDTNTNWGDTRQCVDVTLNSKLAFTIDSDVGGDTRTAAHNGELNPEETSPSLPDAPALKPPLVLCKSTSGM
ncbi:hypothetical protein VTJ49DRAFT_7395 [Mycothermus thermophilus]|uniref:Uncharacterized protein n=1 Tax=Humicola insolens TaxID=85995 RepID=A0ABR3VHD7_HUMIN